MAIVTSTTSTPTNNKQQRQLSQEHMKAMVTIMDIIETPTIVDIGPRLRGNNKLGSLRR
jgi:hypothetical protein